MIANDKNCLEAVRYYWQEYNCLFPDVPSRTNQITHDVDINDASPIKHPYRQNPTKQKHLEEIEYLLQNDFIEPSLRIGRIETSRMIYFERIKTTRDIYLQSS